VIAVSQLGVDVGPLLAAIGAAGFIIGFALQGTLSNFAAGIMILMYQPFDVGDAVEVAGVSGAVEKMTLVSTTIKSWDNKQIVVPNNSIWGDVITNITGNAIRRVDMVFGIGYDDDIEKAQSVLESIIADHEKVLKDPEPTIKLHELGDSSVNFVVRPWARKEDYWGLYWDITKEVKRRFDKEGISIPFPQRDVHIYQENAQA
jgi:small conductance mechanosensitive channel